MEVAKPSFMWNTRVHDERNHSCSKHEFKEISVPLVCGLSSRRIHVPGGMKRWRLLPLPHAFSCHRSSCFDTNRRGCCTWASFIGSTRALIASKIAPCRAASHGDTQNGNIKARDILQGYRECIITKQQQTRKNFLFLVLFTRKGWKKETLKKKNQIFKWNANKRKTFMMDGCLWDRCRLRCLYCSVSAWFVRICIGWLVATNFSQAIFNLSIIHIYIYNKIYSRKLLYTDVVWNSWIVLDYD